MVENMFYPFNQVGRIVTFIKDKNSKYLYVNELGAELAGLDSPSQIIGKSDYDFTWHPQAELFRHDDIRVMRGNVMVNVPQPLTLYNKVATLLNSKTVSIDKAGHSCGVVGYGIDITGYTLTKNNGDIDSQKNIFYLGPLFSNEYLTKRELEVFKHLLMGKSVEEIAQHLVRSIKTIQAQIKSIANKLQCSHKSEIVPTAIKFGLTHVLNEFHLTAQY